MQFYHFSNGDAVSLKFHILRDISFATCPPVPVRSSWHKECLFFKGSNIQIAVRPCCFSAAVSCLSSRCHMVFVTTVVTINFWCWNVISIKHAQPVSAFLCMLCYIRYDHALVTLRKSNAIFQLSFTYLQVHVEIHLIPSILSPTILSQM